MTLTRGRQGRPRRRSCAVGLAARSPFHTSPMRGPGLSFQVHKDKNRNNSVPWSAIVGLGIICLTVVILCGIIAWWSK